MRLGRTVGVAMLCVLVTLAQIAHAQQVEPSQADVTKAANDGQAEAQYALAVEFLEGEGVLQDFASAADWMQKAAQQGHDAAANRLGQMYHDGIGVPQDRASALHWLAQAAASGDSQFIYDYGVVLEAGAEQESEIAKAAESYRQAADKGHLAASVSLAVLLQDGRGVPKDLPAALAIYQQAAEQGSAQAQNNLGLMYVRGDGVALDYDRAFQLFEAAAAQGLAVAIGNLAVMYENGFGVEINEGRAQTLAINAARSASSAFDPTPVYDPRLQPITVSEGTIQRLEPAANAGDPVAQFQLAWVLVTSQNQTFAETQKAATLFRLSAEAGYPAAMANLGLMYFQGQAVPQDYVLGQMWLVLAGAAGFSAALDLNFAMANRMTPAQISEAQALAKARKAQGTRP